MGPSFRMTVNNSKNVLTKLHHNGSSLGILKILKCDLNTDIQAPALSPSCQGNVIDFKALLALQRACLLSDSVPVIFRYIDPYC